MKRILYIISVVLALVIIFNLTNSIYLLWHKQDLLVKTKNELIKAENENKQLKARLQQVNVTGFVEEQARNKLFLVRDGESVILIPSISPTPNAASPSPKTHKPHWQEWWELFF